MENGTDGPPQASQQVSVAVRVRPPLRHEVGHDHSVRVLGRKVVCKVSPPSALASGHREQRQRRVECEFQQVLDMMSTQEDMWQVARPTVDKVLEGFNATIFTYGMTGSGKTYTMLGPEMMALAQEGQAVSRSTNAWKPSAGLLPRSIERLFAVVGNDTQGDSASATLTMSYVQLYRERCYDLLVPAGCAQPLRVREDSSDGGAYVEGLTSARVPSKEACLSKLLYGCSNIAYRTTSSNEQSSRSHVILTLTLRRQQPSGQVRQSKLYLVDLAGNERWNTFGPQMSNLHVKELTCINQSLHALGNCIQALSKPGGQQHVPFRSSALTMLLRDSLSGNSLILLLCTICGCSLYQMQTLCTLRFADRAKRVKLQARVNEVYDKRTLLEQSQAEVEYLRSIVAEAAIGQPVQEKFEKLQGDNVRLAGENSELRRQVANLSASQKLSANLLERGTSGVTASSRGLANRAQTLRGRCCSEPALPSQEDWLSADTTWEGGMGNASTACISMPSSRPKAKLLHQLPQPHVQLEESEKTNENWPEIDAPEVNKPTSTRACRGPHWQTAPKDSRGPNLEDGPALFLQARPSQRNSPCCQLGHAMECLGPSSNPSGVAAYTEWHCDNQKCGSNCLRTPHLSRYHCTTCQYDLCEDCITGAHAWCSQHKARSHAAGFSQPDGTSVHAACCEHRELALRGILHEQLPPRSARHARQSIPCSANVRKHSASRPPAEPQESLSKQQELLIEYYQQKFHPIEAHETREDCHTLGEGAQPAAVKTTRGTGMTPAGSEFSTTAASSVRSRSCREPLSSRDSVPREEARLPHLSQAANQSSSPRARQRALHCAAIGMEQQRHLPLVKVEVPSRTAINGRQDRPLQPARPMQTRHVVRRRPAVTPR
mmetsp:Transcript_27008/g.62366  ORF Transcript_27008/g.62366 Transcript_27008/m.62366 type:complete len:887 (-) Transcript_27008:95-2755(-)